MSDDHSLAALTALDWIAVALTGLAGFNLLEALEWTRTVQMSQV